MKQYKSYTIKVFWDQECFSWLYDIYAPDVENPIAKSWESFDFESECLEAAKKRVDEFVIVSK